MNDMTKRLRSPSTVFYEYAVDDGALLHEAADEIERLKRERAESDARLLHFQSDERDRAFYVRAMLPLLREIGTDEKWAGPLADAVLRALGGKA